MYNQIYRDSWLPRCSTTGRGKLTIRYVPGRDGAELERLVSHLEAHHGPCVSCGRGDLHPVKTARVMIETRAILYPRIDDLIKSEIYLIPNWTCV